MKEYRRITFAGQGEKYIWTIFYYSVDLARLAGVPELEPLERNGQVCAGKALCVEILADCTALPNVL